MPQKGRYYKVGGISREERKWLGQKVSQVRAGTVVKCLKNSRDFGVLNRALVSVQLPSGHIRYIYAFQLEPVKVPKKTKKAKKRKSRG